MSHNAQAKVLRVLQEAVFERVGGTETKRVDVRVIAATNKDLLEASQASNFREDLYYRLNVVPITIPPLRDRITDLPLLVSHFLRQTASELGQPTKKLTKRALDVLKEYSWPGNVRELRNLIERVVILAPGKSVDVGDLPDMGPAKKGEELFFDRDSYTRFKDDVEKEFFERKLRLYGFNVSKTARKLGMQRSNLYKKLEKYGIPYKRSRDDDANAVSDEN
jgi:two-component system nitrogen regulation response regulator NtrX